MASGLWRNQGLLLFFRQGSWQGPGVVAGFDRRDQAYAQEIDKNGLVEQVLLMTHASVEQNSVFRSHHDGGPPFALVQPSPFLPPFLDFFNKLGRLCDGRAVTQKESLWK